MLGKRYEYDGKPIKHLNSLQIEMKRQVERKIENNIYQFEVIPCCICGSAEFKPLAGKDRYGLYMPVVICERCGLIQTNPRMNQESYNEFYNHEYRKLYTGMETPTDVFFQVQYRKGQEIFNYLQDVQVLPKPVTGLFVFEVGCGAGGILQYFRERGCRVKGVDLGEEYLEFGQTKYGLELSVGTIADAQLDEPPDLIIYSHVLEHILTPNEELAQVYRQLSDAGMLYIELPGLKNIIRSGGMDFLRILQNAHTYHFTLTTLENLLRANGFQLVVGDETIKTVFNKSNNYEIETINDYDAVLRYLNKAEILRKLLVVPFYTLKSIIVRVLIIFGLYEVTRDIYCERRRKR